MSIEIDETSKQEIADALSGVLADGQSCFVQCKDNVVTVDAPDALAQFWQDHTELYGYLLSLNEAIRGAVGYFYSFMFVITALACLAVHLAWVDDFLGMPVAKLQSWWLYLVVAVVMFVIACTVGESRYRGNYLRYRRGVMQAIDDAGLTKNSVLAMIHGDDSLARVADQLKSDGPTSDGPRR